MIFGKKKAIPLHDVEIRFQRAGMLSSPADLRKKVKILAIDDQNFPPEKNLSNSGFDVEVFSDIQRISDAGPFPIVLCDVNGVGTSLSEDTQGAYVIDEIKKTYPDKIVVAYTAGSAASKIVSAAKQRSDYYIRKDASIEDWRDLLDDRIRDLCNPIFVWKRERIRLLNAGIELEELLEIEQAILSNLGKGKSAIKRAVESSSENEISKTAWGKEVGLFIASKGFDLAFDYIFQ